MDVRNVGVRVGRPRRGSLIVEVDEGAAAILVARHGEEARYRLTTLRGAGKTFVVRSVGAMGDGFKLQRKWVLNTPDLGLRCGQWEFSRDYVEGLVSGAWPPTWALMDAQGGTMDASGGVKFTLPRAKDLVPLKAPRTVKPFKPDLSKFEVLTPELEEQIRREETRPIGIREQERGIATLPEPRPRRGFLGALYSIFWGE